MDDSNLIPEKDLATTSEAGASAEEMPEQPKMPETDALLQILVQHANRYGTSVTVTLNLGGSMVSGDLVSADIYLDGFANCYRDSFRDKEVGQSFHDQITGHKPNTLLSINADAPVVLPRYVHLRNARIYAPGRPQFTQLSDFWRGRLSEVSGFFLGAPAVKTD